MTRLNIALKRIILAVIFVAVIWTVIYLFFTPLLHRYQIKGILGTDMDLQIIARRLTDVDKLKDGLILEIQRLNKVFSSYLPDSELNKLNQTGYEQPVSLSNEMETVIKSGIEFGSVSGGAFDITALPLIKLWNAVDKSKSDTPSHKEILKARSLVDYRNISLNKGKLRLKQKGMALGLGGSAKGYIIDAGIKYLRNHGIKNALLNIGGDMYAVGKNIRNTSWQISITNPRPDRYSKDMISVVSVENRALATSGDYERYRVSKSGERIHHIIDPKTGYPARESISVSILAPTALLADSIATMIFVIGPQRGLDWVEREKGVEAFIIYERGGKIERALSSGFPVSTIKINK
ncbi:MAG: FAD:protein FMN transferase [Spirochaetota bacterium]|nr:FAD:protein FMN transferase [Spirochaetota bacterium]